MNNNFVPAAQQQGSQGKDVEQVVRHHLVEVAGAVQLLSEQQRAQNEEVSELRANLDIANRGFRSLREEMAGRERVWETERLMLQSRIAAFENSERRVVCLIDGDGTIFSRDLLVQGSQGGQTAARELSKHIHDYLNNTFQMPPSTFALSVYVFLHKKGLMDALGRAGYTTEKSKFEEFLAGFNQAGQRFVMVDVGAGKENADSKVKVFLHDHARSPQTVKILFGGSHDNGYTPDLKSLISDGHGRKLILLPGYTEIASSIRELELATLIIPDLFFPDKLTFFRTPKVNNNVSLPDTSSGLNDSIAGQQPPFNRRGSVSAASAAAVPLPATPGPPIRRLSKSARRRKASRSNNVSEVESVSSDGPSSPPESIMVLSPAAAMDAAPASPPPDPLSSLAPHLLLRGRFNPPPCQKHYLLGNCPFKTGCKFEHGYTLTSDDMKDLAASAKGILCKEIAKGRQCAMNERCIYGHICPYGPMCPHLARGTCHFKFPGMHDA